MANRDAMGDATRPGPKADVAIATFAENRRSRSRRLRIDTCTYMRDPRGEGGR